MVGLNAVWTVDSFALGLLDWITPNTFGSLFLYGQAVAVEALTGLAVVGWRTSRGSEI